MAQKIIVKSRNHQTIIGYLFGLPHVGGNDAPLFSNIAMMCRIQVEPPCVCKFRVRTVSGKPAKYIRYMPFSSVGPGFRAVTMCLYRSVLCNPTIKRATKPYEMRKKSPTVEESKAQ